MHRYVLSLTFLHPIFVNVAGILSVCCEIQDTRQRTLVGTPDRIGKVLHTSRNGAEGMEKWRTQRVPLLQGDGHLRFC